MLENITKKTVLAEKIIECRSFFSQFKGIMFKRHFKNTAYIFYIPFESKFASAIHSWFCFIPFDILWLNKDYIVIDLKEKIPPFKSYIEPKVPAKYFIELPSGTIKKTKTKEGDKLNF